jgi:hypothetical protein
MQIIKVDVAYIDELGYVGSLDSENSPIAASGLTFQEMQYDMYRRIEESKMRASDGIDFFEYVPKETWGEYELDFELM